MLIADLFETAVKEDRTAQVELDNGEQRQVRWIPGRRDMLDMIIAYYARQGRRVQRVDDVDIDWEPEPVKVNEISRRGVLKGMGVAAGAAALPSKTLARTLAPTSTVGTSEPVTGYVWNRVGDAVDQKHLSGLVDRITQGLTRMHQARQAEYHSETEIRNKLNAILRKHIPGMSQKDRLEHGQWEAMMQDFDRELPLPALPPDVPDFYNDSDQVWAEWLEDHPQWDYDRLESMLRRREDYESNIRNLAITTRAANMGNTENYGYQVQHKIKTGRIKPVDYSKPSTSVAAQAAQTAATQIPRGAAASALGSAGAALRNLGSRARDLVTKKAAAAVVKPDAPRALAAPSTDAEFMRDLQNRVTEPQKQKVDEITLGSEEELFAGGDFLPRIDVDAEDSDIRPLDQRYALWPQRHIQDIAREDDAIGEQFSDWDTAGILDTQTGRAVAFIAWQDAYRSPFPGAVEIHQVEVDPRLRGQGFARYLYELVRRQHTLLADEDQTPNGARMWVGMQQAGLPVQGYISFGSGRTPEELDAEGEARFSYVEELKKMNAKLINPGGRFPVYVFPVQAQGGRLDTPAKTPLKVYRSGYTNQWTPGLVVMKGG